MARREGSACFWRLGGELYPVASRSSFSSSTSLTRSGFQTDTDISAGARGAERELKPWAPEPDHGPNGSASNGGVQRERERDVLTFGAPPSSVPWDQFRDNERLFGVTTDYDEEIYTTKLDRSGPGYKKRERDADRLAAEMLAVGLHSPQPVLTV